MLFINKKKYLFFILFGILIIPVSYVSYKIYKKPRIDWNDTNLSWIGYPEGLHKAAKEHKPIMLIFYADWCPTCKTFGKLFKDRQVVAYAKYFVMVRINVDKNPSLNDKFSFNGNYTPRIFVLKSNGDIMENLYRNHDHRYLVDWNIPDELLRLMNDAINDESIK